MAQPATTDSPQIVISYHSGDEKWRDRLVTHLDLALEKFGVYHDRVPHGQKLFRPSAEVLFALQQAKVWLLLISPNYTKSSWILSAQGYSLVSDLANKGMFIVPVMLEELPTEDFRTLQALKLSPSTKRFL